MLNPSHFFFFFSSLMFILYMFSSRDLSDLGNNDRVYDVTVRVNHGHDL